MCEQGFMVYSHFPIPTRSRLQWMSIRVGLWIGLDVMWTFPYNMIQTNWSRDSNSAVKSYLFDIWIPCNALQTTEMSERKWTNTWTNWWSTWTSSWEIWRNYSKNRKLLRNKKGWGKYRREEEKEEERRRRAKKSRRRKTKEAVSPSSSQVHD